MNGFLPAHNPSTPRTHPAPRRPPATLLQLARLTLLTLLAALTAHAATPARAEDTPAPTWADLFAFVPPPVDASGVCKGEIGDLPVVQHAGGLRMFRGSVAFPPGAFPVGMALNASYNHPGGQTFTDVQVRPLTLHPGSPPSVRRAIITFPGSSGEDETSSYRFSLAGPVKENPPLAVEEVGDIYKIRWEGRECEVGRDRIHLSEAENRSWTGTVIAPPQTAPEPCKFEVIEHGPHFIWVRLLAGDSLWPRIIELKAFAEQGFSVSCQLQRLEPGDAVAPDFGWTIDGPPLSVGGRTSLAASPELSPNQGGFTSIHTQGGQVLFEEMETYRRGTVESVDGADGSRIVYLRCRASEGVPFQESAWRSATFESDHCEMFRSMITDASDTGPPSGRKANNLSPFFSLRSDTADWIGRSGVIGDDFGNITGFNKGSEHGGAYGMNRLNHCAAMFEEGVGAATQWCLNMHDLSIWWKPGKGFGGTRYNNASAAGQDEHKGDKNFMWRTNGASDFCTKGYDSFLYAYEETGDPRFATALRHQVEYAATHVHANKGECRNIGDAADFMRLYKLTGVPRYKDEAMRLFRELREKVGDDNLFSQGGQPLHPDETFIDDDAHGYEHPFRKPYILGYALAGLPALLELEPDEPRLRDIIRATADFLAASQDPTGGWRYPHPKSSYVIIDQGMEHSAQIARAARVLEKRGEQIENLLDAIERTLQGRIIGYERTGTILSGLSSWEKAAGMLKDGQTLYDLYKRPEDRDASRDYTEGNVGVGSASPEGLAYFGEVLDFYLAHRPAARLYIANKELMQVLDRVPDAKPWPPKPAEPFKPSAAIEHDLPSFAAARSASMGFNLAWQTRDAERDFEGKPHLFGTWRIDARARLIEALGERPATPEFHPLEPFPVEDRGTYHARKIVMDLSTGPSAAYLLVPKGPGPFPAVLALHDHGAHFSIGKEKVVRPFGVEPAVMEDAQKWVNDAYGGRWIGDELAKRGYVVFSTDALFWGERGRAEGVDYKAQERLAANLFQLGMSWSGVIAWDDLASAEFLQSRPEVIPGRIGAIGLSMGASRTWHLAALTDIIKAGAAICWMGDTKTLMQPGNNQTKGQSAWSMLHPGLRNDLDYPDVASIAAPKPMLFFNGAEDALFPVEGVEACYAKMRSVWNNACNGDKGLAEKRLVTKLWPVPHAFNAEMQEEAFAFLDKALKP